MKIKKSYKYGIELEVLVPDHHIDKLKRLVAEKRLPFAFKYDGSIEHGYDQEGVEIVASRPLTWTELERGTKALSAILIELDVSVNKSTGFHVHISNNDRFFNQKTLKRIMYLWAAIEDVLLATQPPSRYNNDYCMRFLKRYVESTGDLPKVKTQLLTEVRRISRYYTLNLTALADHGTLETRMHSGTVDSKKILNWVLLQVAIYEYCLGKHYSQATVKELFESEISDAKIKKVFEVLALTDAMKEHFTARIEKFGWTLLAKQQKGAIEALKFKDTVAKAEKKLKQAELVYNKLHSEVTQARNVRNSSLRVFHESL